MNLVRRENSPLSFYRPIEDRFERMFENMFQDFFSPFIAQSALSGGEGGDIVSPRLNVKETDKTYEIEVEIPGVKKEDVKVAVDNQRISIEGEVKRESAQKEGENIVYAERSIKKFARSVMLPVEVDDAGAQAKLENGVLMLTLPKKVTAQPKKLTIQ
ncbi:heat shock protein Hsp20 [Paucimonas lemoignei]|uniref:Heat shock protein Hsp20 n=1 Tax=Paucimonas lemoignei TaxID=29443 RepID=A0A4R3HYI4_PAULE|nr:Hsp20/alpha crystallin family protein [Paucimonas lemoignei]TCS38396.1 heat shock protein Hsp20 [Paucimonas lemoignei]